jgi:hypothetical protein
VTILRTILEKGYFPKELPPAFSTAQFAAYATTKHGRAVLAAYKPKDNFTECVAHELALPGIERRHLRIPHPASFARLAALTSKNMKRLLKLGGASSFSKSRPVYSTTRQRAIGPSYKPSNLARERMASRAGAAYLLRLDVSQFYPSLYTHAVGWAVDPSLRKRTNWSNKRLLGKQLDQALMDLQGKVSQGVPIGNDISFLLSELVLARVDQRLGPEPARKYRWYDDYEIACDTRHEAEEVLKRLVQLLSLFKLRVNPHKTEIVALPRPSQDEWHQILADRGSRSLARPGEMLQYFDTAFRLRALNPDAPVLLYTLGLLFRLRCPTDETARVAQSGVTQALLCEPGAAQKAFSLLTFWQLNGFAFDRPLLAATIGQMILRHKSSGVSSDVSWALAFCLEHKLSLPAAAASALSTFIDDCVAIQALHASSQGLLPRGFTPRRISPVLSGADMDGDHWLAAYEVCRQGFLPLPLAQVRANSLFSSLLDRQVSFYRTRLPSYASVIHPGGAPEWILTKWLSVLQGEKASDQETTLVTSYPALALVKQDLERLDHLEASRDEAVADLLDVLERDDFVAAMQGEEPYA